MVRSVRVHKVGGPEVLSLEDVELGAPGPGMVTVRHHAIGLNFIDTYHRSGLYPLELPTGIGLEAAGVVEAVGEGADLEVGDRVAGDEGSYPHDDIAAAMGEDGKWQFVHKDGTPY